MNESTINDILAQSAALRKQGDAFYEAADSLDNAVKVLQNATFTGLNHSDFVEKKIFADNNPAKVDNTPSDYKPEWNLINKAMYALKKSRRFLQLNEIISYLKTVEPNIDIKSSSLSSNISRFKKIDSELYTLRVGKSPANSFIGFRSWLGDHEQPLEQHMYDKSRLVGDVKNNGAELFTN